MIVEGISQFLRGGAKGGVDRKGRDRYEDRANPDAKNGCRFEIFHILSKIMRPIPIEYYKTLIFAVQNNEVTHGTANKIGKSTQTVKCRIW